MEPFGYHNLQNIYYIQQQKESPIGLEQTQGE